MKAGTTAPRPVAPRGRRAPAVAVGLLVLVADCFPVALSDGEQVAMLHCGWRPLAGGIIEVPV